MKYTNQTISFQELPSEISLVFEISNCPNRCKGCHTPELQSDIGDELTLSVLQEAIIKNSINQTPLFSCVLFMGGDQHPELIPLLQYCKQQNLKIGLYTGNNNVSNELKQLLDYLKVGPYIEELGGLDSEKTNQVLYRIIHNSNNFNLEKINMIRSR